MGWFHQNSWDELTMHHLMKHVVTPQTKHTLSFSSSLIWFFFFTRLLAFINLNKKDAAHLPRGDIEREDWIWRIWIGDTKLDVTRKYFWKELFRFKNKSNLFFNLSCADVLLFRLAIHVKTKPHISRIHMLIIFLKTDCCKACLAVLIFTSMHVC
jgi:hypothetical protein